MYKSFHKPANPSASAISFIATDFFTIHSGDFISDKQGLSRQSSTSSSSLCWVQRLESCCDWVPLAAVAAIVSACLHCYISHAFWHVIFSKRLIASSVSYLMRLVFEARTRKIFVFQKQSFRLNHFNIVDDLWNTKIFVYEDRTRAPFTQTQKSLYLKHKSCSCAPGLSLQMPLEMRNKVSGTLIRDKMRWE